MNPTHAPCSFNSFIHISRVSGFNFETTDSVKLYVSHQGTSEIDELVLTDPVVVAWWKKYRQEIFKPCASGWNTRLEPESEPTPHNP